MPTRFVWQAARWSALFLAAFVPIKAADFVPRRVTAGDSPGEALVRIDVTSRAPQAIPRFITGKFAEHLGWNIYNGMDAQILRNATFADYPFATGQMTPDGVAQFHWENNRINEELRRQARRCGWPEAALDELVRSRADGLATFWSRIGEPGKTVVSPDTGPAGGRAQRVEIGAAGGGIGQWTWLPLHRVRRFDFELCVRSSDLDRVLVTLASGDEADAVRAETLVTGIGPDWGVRRGTLELPANAPDGRPYRFAIVAEGKGGLVIRHAFLRPADHVGGADPDIVRLLRESRLPLLRWPGGNFVSGYHWEEGVGPVERRPTRPNFAWGGVEPNTFGTDEFVAFCRAVGCEPMICVNAGDGTPEEAARWIEYCNGPATSPMGARRAANGHPEPYGIRHWEVGNELWGRWQFHWTTASGNVDRYRRFAPVLRAADPTIELYACGAPVFWGKAWNDTLMAGAASLFQTITDHPLIGGDVALSADPVEVYRDFMAVPEVLEAKWAGLRDDLGRAGVREPRLAVTELQIFAHLGRAVDGQPVRLNRENLPGQGSITEAIYDVLIYHAAIRLAPFVSMITHSAVVNHGGGLRKERERVYANPCHHAQAAFAAFADATPVAVEVRAVLDRAPRVLPDLRNATPAAEFAVVDALGAVAKDGSLLVSLVHRGTAGPVRVRLEFPGFQSKGDGTLRLLAGANGAAGNSLEAPETIRPVDRAVPVQGDRLEVELPPYSVARLTLPAASGLR